MVFVLDGLCWWESSWSFLEDFSHFFSVTKYRLRHPTFSVLHVNGAAGWGFPLFDKKAMTTSDAQGQCEEAVRFLHFYSDKVNRRSVKRGSPRPQLLLSFLLSFRINQYLLTKALLGFSPLSVLLFIFQDVIREHNEMSRSSQGKYLSWCHRESRGGGVGVRALL